MSWTSDVKLREKRHPFLVATRSFCLGKDILMSWPHDVKLREKRHPFLVATRSFCGGNNGIAVRLPLSLIVEVFCAVSGQTLP